MMMPVMSFFGGKFNDFSRTRVKKTATKSTDNTLDALKVITTGKLVLAAAIVYEKVEIKIMKAQIKEFLTGICTR